MSLVSLAAGITDLAVRAGQECKSIRAALAALRTSTVPQGVGAVNTLGTATDLARADHVHQGFGSSNPPALADLAVTAWPKPQVRLAITTSTALSGVGQTIDSRVVAAGDRIMVTGQTSDATNGIYVASAGAWSRAADAATAPSLIGAVVRVTDGLANQFSTWQCSQVSTSSITHKWYMMLDTSDLSSTPAAALTASGTAGTSLQPARADHTHPTEIPDTGWVSGWAVNSINTGFTAGPAYADYRQIGKVVHVRVALVTNAAIDASATTDGDITNRNVVTGLPSAQCPTQTVIGGGRWADVPTAVILTTAGVISVTGVLPRNYASGTRIECEFQYMV